VSSSWPDYDYNSPEYRIFEPPWDHRLRNQLEKERLSSAWSTIAIGEQNGMITRLAGTVMTASGWVRDFQIIVPGGYPYSPPDAFSYGWALSGPHCYSESEMCLWQKRDWDPTYTLAYAVAKTFTWIHKHDEFLRTGRWPGNEQRH
jgi:ubiquitin-protein ligase